MKTKKIAIPIQEYLRLLNWGQHHQILGDMHNGIFNFKEEALTLPFKYPTLVYSETEVGISCLIGELKLQDEEGLYIDSYQIKILPSENYPYRFPLVFETNNRIPINEVRHVFADGHACIKSEAEEIYLCKAGINLI